MLRSLIWLLAVGLILALGACVVRRAERVSRREQRSIVVFQGARYELRPDGRVAVPLPGLSQAWDEQIAERQ